MPLTVGTAGHIDHGKTWLVRALTGKDTDRLPEEQRRGISIDLGYAPLELVDGRRLSLIDVPGHERFVRTMVAGATGIDLFLLVIDAGEGARPQTHEHLAILRLLGIERGVVALTKVDAVDAETIELAEEEARELVPGAAVVRVSARTGEGIDDLRAELGRVADEAEHARADAPTRLPVDRSISIPGFGTVVTGTLWSGSVAAGDRLRLEPSGRDVRVRSVQVHDRDVERAEAGQRVAVSLPGVERGDVGRGEALVAPGRVSDVVPPRRRPRRARPDRGERARARASRDGGRPGEGRPRRRSVRPAAARSSRRRGPRRSRRPARGDDARRRSRPRPGATAPPRRRTTRAPRRRATSRRTIDVARAARDAAPRPSRRARRRRARGAVGLLRELARRSSRMSFARASRTPIRSIPACRCRRDPWAADVLPARAARAPRLEALPARAPPRRSSGRTAEADALAAELVRAGMRATLVEDEELARFLEASGRLVRLGDGYVVGADAFEIAKDVVLVECAAEGGITLARFRDLAGTGPPRRAAPARASRRGRSHASRWRAAGVAARRRPRTLRIVRYAIPTLLAAVGVLAAPAAAVDVAPRALVLRSADVPAGWALDREGDRPSHERGRGRNGQEEPRSDRAPRSGHRLPGRVAARRDGLDRLEGRRVPIDGRCSDVRRHRRGQPPFLWDQGAPAEPGAHRRLGVRLPRRPKRHRRLGRLAVRRRRRNGGRLGRSAGHDAGPRAKATASNRRSLGLSYAQAVLVTGSSGPALNQVGVLSGRRDAVGLRARRNDRDARDSRAVEKGSVFPTHGHAYRRRASLTLRDVTAGPAATRARRRSRPRPPRG